MIKGWIHEEPIRVPTEDHIVGRDWWFPTVRVLFMLVVTLAEGPATAVVVDGYVDYWAQTLAGKGER